ncbi:cell division protein FtsA [Asticcacaulis solisilvae]|uniref:cell division protein FtsA n=1 Tax=Asticcacaulis solisilvae TaxID=1217274 RepID=UPI003FD84329
MTSVLSAYATARSSRSWPRDRIERHQQTLWRQMPLDDYPALKAFAGQKLSDLPIVDVADYRARFAAFNRHGLTQAAATAAAQAAEAGHPGELPDGLRAGFSTGTSGTQRGVFVTSPQERSTYMGSLLGKLMSPADLLTTQRVALCLRAGNDLYRPAIGPRVGFFPLTPDHGPLVEAIADFKPQVLIAPPQVLLSLAEAGKPAGCRRIFYGAEALNDTERAFITERLGARPDPIYQATEGFLGAPCRLGTLHLNEDSLIIERDDLGGGTFRPIVTDLKRRTQAVVRLRLDDVLWEMRCACGSRHAAVKPVCGRVQDAWTVDGRTTVWPDGIENEVAPHIAPSRRWIATQYHDRVTVACPDAGDAATIHERLNYFGVRTVEVPYDPALDFPKRRHVRRVS